MDRYRSESRRAEPSGGYVDASAGGAPSSAEAPYRAMFEWLQRLVEERTRDHEFELSRLQERIRGLERTPVGQEGNGELRSRLDELQVTLRAVVSDLRKECRDSVDQATSDLQREQGEGLSRLRLEALRHVLQETQKVRKAADQTRAEVEEMKAATSRMERQIAADRHEARAQMEEFARQLEERANRVAEDLSRRFEAQAQSVTEELSRKLDERVGAVEALVPQQTPSAAPPAPVPVVEAPTPAPAAPAAPRAPRLNPERRSRCLWVQEKPAEVAQALDSNGELLEERLLQMWVENRIEGVRDAWDHHRARMEELRVTAPALAERLRNEIEKTSGEGRAQESDRLRSARVASEDLGEAVA